MGHQHWSRSEDAALTLAVREALAKGRTRDTINWQAFPAFVHTAPGHYNRLRTPGACLDRAKRLDLFAPPPPPSPPERRCTFRLDRGEFRGFVRLLVKHPDEAQAEELATALQDAITQVLGDRMVPCTLAND